MKIGASAKGLSWTFIPYARSWLGLIRVWSMVSPIHISLFEDGYHGIPCIRVVVCCGCLNYCQSLYDFVCVSVWRDVTFLARKIHDDVFRAAENCVRVWIHLHRAVYHWSSALGWYLPLPILKSRYIVPLSWINSHDALQYTIVSCCASQCDKYAVD